jgi:hypothetical protein
MTRLQQRGHIDVPIHICHLDAQLDGRCLNIRLIQHTLLDIRPCTPRQEVEDRLRFLVHSFQVTLSIALSESFNFPFALRQEVEDRLRLLAAFLGDVLGRARARLVRPVRRAGRRRRPQRRAARRQAPPRGGGRQTGAAAVRDFS